MDIVDRLTPEEEAEPTVLALTRIHRYRLAAELCADMRVMDLASGDGYGTRILAETARRVSAVERDDTAAALAGDLAGEYDAIVVFEALEHLDDIDGAVDSLRRHAAAGLMIIVSLPNLVAFREGRHDRDAEFDLERAGRVFDRIGAATRLYQFHAEGSLIRSAEDGPLAGGSTLPERAELEHANHLIAIANPPDDFVATQAWARARFSVAPAANTYVLDLERANRRLWRTNQALARERLGVADSAAAATLERVLARGGIQGASPAGPLRRLGGRIKRVITLITPHGIVLIRMRLRDRRADDDEQ